MPIFTQSQLQADINSKIKGKIGILTNVQSTINQGVRQAFMDIDFRSSRRRAQLTPNLFSGIFEYAAPTDLKDYGIITVQNQKWTRTPFWSLVPYEQFMRRQDSNTIAVSDYELMRKLFIKSEVYDTKVVLSNLDTLSSGGGTWEAFGDATNVSVSSDNFVEGMASIQYDISAVGGTTAGIKNDALNSSDLSAYFQGDGNVVVWAYITSTTDITNFILRVGSDSSNYYSKTVAAQSDGTAFVNGWNLLNFNLATFSTTGSPIDTAIEYCAVYMTKAVGKVNEVGYRFDYLTFRRGEINNLYYYSSYGWTTSAGVYIANSTAPSDILIVDTEEYEIILAKCTELAAEDCDEDKVADKASKRYEKLKTAYQMSNPSEALNMIVTVATFVKV